MLRIFGSNDERSGLAGVYTFNSSDRYFGYAVVNANSESWPGHSKENFDQSKYKRGRQSMTQAL